MHSSTQISFLFCLVLCTPNVVAASRCIYDELSAQTITVPISVTRELPNVGEEGITAFTASIPDWAPIRILVSTKDLEDGQKYCENSNDVRPDFSGNTAICDTTDILTNQKKDSLVNKVIPTALKLHADRLMVRPLKGLLKVPNYSNRTTCYHFKIPPAHRHPGIVGYDTVFYAAAGPVDREGVLAWALVCSPLDDGRPTVGAMNFNPKHISSNARVVRFAAHEMAHALGFGFTTFSQLGMGNSYTPVRHKSNIFIINSRRTVEKVREHFNCADAVGMELEDEGSSGTRLSHWERRNLMDELMNGMNSHGVYSALTIAAFEDMGFYKGNFSMAEHLEWGKDAGCNFLTERCVEQGVTQYPSMFCTNITKGFQCPSDRSGLGFCLLGRSANRRLPEYQYFEDPYKGGPGGSLLDQCPFVEMFGDLSCASGYEEHITSSLFGPNSLCLNGDSLMMGTEVIGDICAEVKCNDDGLRVRYRGDDRWHNCPEGDFITPTETFTSGRIKCPKYAEVCTIAKDGSSRLPFKKPRVVLTMGEL